MVQVVAEKGFAAVTVTDTVERASVSRRTFYADKEACFLAACHTGFELVLTRMGVAQRKLGKDANWRDRMRSDLRSYLDVLAAEPAFARALHVEALVAGPGGPGAPRRDLRALLRADPAALRPRARTVAPRTSAEAFLLRSGGVDEIIRECLRTRNPATLRELSEPVADATVAFFGGA